MASYVQVTRQDIRQIHKTNEQQSGAFLLAEVKTGHHLIGPDNATLQLFRKATLDFEDKYGPSLETKLDLGRNREYTLRPKRQPLPANAPDHARQWAEAGDFFEDLNVGNYRFQIYGLFVTSTTLFRDAGKVLFIPRWSEQAFAEAMTDTLHDIADVINATAKKNKTLPTGLGPHEVKTLVDYVINDIKTGQVVAHNIQAGQNADAFLGM